MSVQVTSTGGSAYALLEQTWRPRLARQANEEEMIVDTFDNGNEGVEKFGLALNIRKILRIAATKTAYTSTLNVTSPTYTANTEVNVPLYPTFAYGAVELGLDTLTRLIAAPELQAAYRKQMLAGVVAQKDADGGALAASLTTTQKGGAAQTFDKAFLLDGIGALIEQCRELYQPGRVGWAYLHYTPRQYKYVHAIPEIVNANLRGDGEQVIKKGWTWNAFGLELRETGNVYISGGIAHNMLHIRESHVIGYNQREKMLTPQDYALAVRLHCICEYGVGEIWDEYGADMQTIGS